MAATAAAADIKWSSTEPAALAGAVGWLAVLIGIVALRQTLCCAIALRGKLGAGGAAAGAATDRSALDSEAGLGHAGLLGCSTPAAAVAVAADLAARVMRDRRCLLMYLYKTVLSAVLVYRQPLAWVWLFECLASKRVCSSTRVCVAYTAGTMHCIASHQEL